MIDKEKIAQQAKHIMDSFMSALTAAEKVDPEFKVKREQNTRNNNATLTTNDDFPERMLKNAPAVKDHCVLAEKKKW